MFAKTEHLLLRPAWPEDAQELLAAINNFQTIHNLASAPWPYGLDDAQEFVSRPQDYRYPHFVISCAMKAYPRLIGSCGLGKTEDEDSAELGYWIAPEYQGHGYATEAGRMVIEIASMLGFRRIIASHYHDNPASGRVLEKLGMKVSDQFGKRYSKGRGRADPVVEYVLELDAGTGKTDEDDLRSDPYIMTSISGHSAIAHGPVLKN